MDIIERLKHISGYSSVVLTSSGNGAIFAALHICKLLGKTEVLIPKDGGWYSYRKYPGLLGMDCVEVETDWALLDLVDLKKKCSKRSVLLYSVFGGYFVAEPTNEIAKIVRGSGGLVIGDITAAVGKTSAKDFDIAVASFGEHKPLEVGHGGMIASNTPIATDTLSMMGFPDAMIPRLESAVSALEGRWKFFLEKRKAVQKDVSKLGEVAHPDRPGLNIVVKGQNPKVIEYCKKNQLPFVLCPRYHRVKQKAVSIEIKRLKPGV